MARELDQQELLDIQIEGYDVLAKKIQEYESKGKKPFRAHPNGPGVMPQELFDDLRDKSDPDYKKADIKKNSDGHRKYPVDIVVMHHSVGPVFSNSGDLTVQDWFDIVGRNRGYKGVARSFHRHPRRNKETFSQAHHGLHPYTANKNKYSWRLTLLMKDPFNNVAWHAGNWPVNQRSIGIETCGNYVGKKLPLKALMLVADTFRAHDKKIGGFLNITYHRLYSATACPGQIAGQTKTIIDMINNPAKWNAKLWPKPKPPVVKPKPPAPKPTTKVVKKYVRYGMPLSKVFNKNASLWNFNKTGWSFKAVKSFKKGEEFIAVGDARHSNGGIYLMTSYSFGQADKTGSPTFTHGVNIADLIARPLPPKTVPPPVPPKPKIEPKPIPPKPPPKVVTEPPQEPEEIKKREEVKPVNTKPGVKTTEFYIVLIPYALMILKQVFNVDIDQEVIVNGILGIISVVTTGFYIWSRVQVKLSQNSN